MVNKLNRYLRSAIILFTFGILLTGNQGYAIPHTLQVGDSFTFSITDFVILDEVNGTNYVSDDSPIREGDKIEVTIESIENGTFMVDPTSAPLVGTVVNVTEKVGDESYESISVLDGWADLVTVFAFLYLFSGLFLIDYPESGSFVAPSQPTDDNDVTGGTGLPYFATSNESYYKQMADGFNTSFYSFGSGYDISTVDGNSNYDPSTAIFSQNLEAKVTDTNQTSRGDAVSLEIIFKYDVSVDVARSLVMKFYAEFKFFLSIGEASRLMHFKLGFIEGVDGGASPAPALNIFIALVGLIVISVALRRRKN